MFIDPRHVGIRKMRAMADDRARHIQEAHAA